LEEEEEEEEEEAAGGGGGGGGGAASGTHAGSFMQPGRPPIGVGSVRRQRRARKAAPTIGTARPSGAASDAPAAAARARSFAASAARRKRFG
jgi:hypothetical protein